MATAVQSSLKHLSDSGLITSLPSFYASQKAESCDADVAIEEQVPVIDFSLFGGTEEERLQVLQELDRACKEWGFFMVVNHGVPEDVMGRMVAALEEFFDLTDEEKMKYPRKSVFDPIQCGTSFNWEAEQVTYWRDFFKASVHPELYSPDKPAGFRDILREYSTSTRNLIVKLLKAIWESLDLDINVMNDALDLDSSFGILAANLYPPCPQPELVFGLPPHSDYGLLVALLQHGADGLQVMHNGSWVQVKPLPNSLLINTGDQLEIVTNGRYKSVVHRATLNNKSTRMSVVTPLGPSLEAIVVPAPDLVSRGDNHARYKSMKYREYLERHQTHRMKDKSPLDLLRLPVE